MSAHTPTFKIRHCILCIVAGVLLLSPKVMIGQGHRVVISGTNTFFSSALPYNLDHRYGSTQSLYTAAEVGCSGTIDTIWYYSQSSSTVSLSSLSVYMGTTPISALRTALSASQLVEVYAHSNVTVGGLTGWQPIVLDQPYDYDSLENLVVVVCKQDYTVAADVTFRVSEEPFGRARSKASNANLSYGTIDSTGGELMMTCRPDIQLHIDPAVTTCRKPMRLRVVATTRTTATLTWESSMASSWRVRYGVAGSTQTSTDMLHVHTYTITGLTPGIRYSFHVATLCSNGDSSAYSSCSFVTASNNRYPSCIDATDLYATGVQATRGTFWDPYAHSGIVNYGPNSMFSRHTVHTSMTETDPRTDSLLYTIPPGETASVRLGNWNTNAEAESISYRMTVDSVNYGLLILRYAAVMENPEHPAVSQPRLTIEIMDSNDQLISPTCGYADFVSSSSLGWNMVNYDILWKDWTTVGFDVSAYHGHTVKVRLTTYDCSAGAHYGYAYFTLGCGKKRLTSATCGNTDSSTFSAPSGFNYDWHTATGSATLSTAQSITVSNDGTSYVCDVSFAENAACYFSISATAVPRYPHSAFSYSIDTLPQQQYHIAFQNNSRVTTSTDASDTTSYGIPEDFVWLINDNVVSTSVNASMDMPCGHYKATLISGLSNFACADTLSQWIWISCGVLSDTTHATVCGIGTYLWHGDTLRQSGTYCDTLFNASAEDTICILFLNMQDTSHVVETIAACDSLWWNGRLFVSDTSGVTFDTTSAAGCDSTTILNLTVNHSQTTQLEYTLCQGKTYDFYGEELTEAGTYEHHLTTQQGCDSLIRLTLHVTVTPAVTVERMTTECGRDQLQATTNAPYLRWSACPIDPWLDGTDNATAVWVSPRQTTTYTVEASLSPLFSCPGAASITLKANIPPEAKIEAHPPFLTYDNLTLTLRDRSKESNDREWIVNGESKGNSSTLTYNASKGEDSVMVTLIAMSDTCQDTATATIPIRKHTIYAPNAFTPDEETNNQFNIIAKGLVDYELYIYDRLGILMFHSTDQHEGWDGTSKGSKCPQAAYVYILFYHSVVDPATPHSIKGTVLLLR